MQVRKTEQLYLGWQSSDQKVSLARMAGQFVGTFSINLFSRCRLNMECITCLLSLARSQSALCALNAKWRRTGAAKPNYREPKQSSTALHSKNTLPQRTQNVPHNKQHHPPRCSCTFKICVGFPAVFGPMLIIAGRRI